MPAYSDSGYVSRLFISTLFDTSDMDSQPRYWNIWPFLGQWVLHRIDYFSDDDTMVLQYEILELEESTMEEEDL